jgi:hypothetical protein
MAVIQKVIIIIKDWIIHYTNGPDGHCHRQGLGDRELGGLSFAEFEWSKVMPDPGRSLQKACIRFLESWKSSSKRKEIARDFFSEANIQIVKQRDSYVL